MGDEKSRDVGAGNVQASLRRVSLHQGPDATPEAWTFLSVQGARDLPRSFTPGREVSGGLGSAQSLTVHSGGGRRTPNRGREVPVRLAEPLSSRNHYWAPTVNSGLLLGIGRTYL